MSIGIGISELFWKGAKARIHCSVFLVVVPHGRRARFNVCGWSLPSQKRCTKRQHLQHLSSAYETPNGVLWRVSFRQAGILLGVITSSLPSLWPNPSNTSNANKGGKKKRARPYLVKRDWGKLDPHSFTSKATPSDLRKPSTLSTSYLNGFSFFSPPLPLL